MNHIFFQYNQLATRLDRWAKTLLPTLARLVFAGVLLVYFWTSAQTKLAGIFTPSDGAYIQIFPRVAESFGYDFSKFGFFHWATVMAGTYAEIILPSLIVVGLMTRLAALGMIGFIGVQSVTDVLGHGVAGQDLGTWFDAASGALISDQRALWIVMLAVLVLKGSGPLAVDRLLGAK